MTEIDDSFVNAGPFSSSAASAAAAMATTVGYQVLSLLKVGRDVLSASIITTEADISSINCQEEGTDIESAPKDAKRLTKRLSSSSEVTCSSEELPVYSLYEISFHDSPDDCWMAIYDLVYDVTDFLQEHPGGDEIMIEYAGRDATMAFRSVGHSKAAETALKAYLVGRLPENERMWTRISNKDHS